MNNAQTRAAIAARMNTIEGVRGYVTRPAAPKAGDSWPQWGGYERADGYAELNTWRVMLVLDQSSEAWADAAADRWGADLIETLAPVLYVSALAPAELTTQTGPLYALMITGRTE